MFLRRSEKKITRPSIWILKRTKSSHYKGPLNGIRVCDLSRVLVGPYCSMILGDMGAEVIKIERPGIGDETRTWGPPFVGTESVYFMSINRNKKSICVDMKTDEGKDLIYEIVKKSDVFLENFQTGKLDSLGLGYDKLSDLNPSLIYCSMTGYGNRGHMSKKPGYDLVASALGGMLHMTGPKGGDVSRSGVAVTDILTGMYTHSAICTALYDRKFSGKGMKIDASLFQSQVAMLHDVASAYLNTGIDSERTGTAHSFIVPYQSFKTSDRDIVIAAGNDRIFTNLCREKGTSQDVDIKNQALKLDSLPFNTKYITNAQRVKNREVLTLLLQERLLDKPSSEWLQILEEYAVPCSLINDIKEAFETDQVQSLGIIQEIQHPSVGTVKVAGPAVEYDGESILSPPLPPPLLGQHTVEIMKNLLHMNENSIDTLLANEVVYQNGIA